MRVVFTDRQTTQFFYKVETYLNRLLVPEMYVIPNFVKIVRVVLEIYESCVHGQTKKTDSPIFYKIETYLDRLLVSEIYVIPNFVKIVRAVLDIYENCIHRQIDRQKSQFFTRLRPI